MVKIQEYVEKKYSDKNTTTEIILDKGTVLEEGGLTLKDYPKLVKINLARGKEINALVIENCPGINSINIIDNKIKEIKGIEQLNDLVSLEMAINQITDSNIVIKNPKLEILNCHNNPLTENKINLNIKHNLKFFSGGTVEKQNVALSAKESSEEELKNKLEEIAKKLGVKDDDLKGKKAEEIEKIINGEADEIKKNQEDINNKFPGLIDKDGKVDGGKLDEIKNKVDEAKNLKEIIDKTGIDPTDLDKAKQKADEIKKIEEALDKTGISKTETEKDIRKLQEGNERLKEIVRDKLGTEFLAQVEINTIKN